MYSQFSLLVLLIVLFGAGCGTIKGRTATEQLLVSDAVDQSIDQIDFSRLSGSSVYLDLRYLKPVRGVGFVNSEYIISSLRERMILANCRLTENRDDAECVVEVRVGALGSDHHEVNYGVPGSQTINQTAALVTSAPLPSVPEISLAKTDSSRAAAKISLFAYERETFEPIWQSGTSQGVSLAQSTWVLGAGPFQKGEIYEKNGAFQTPPIELPDVETERFIQPMVAFFKRPFSSARSQRNRLQSFLLPPDQVVQTTRSTGKLEASTPGSQEREPAGDEATDPIEQIASSRASTDAPERVVSGNEVSADTVAGAPALPDSLPPRGPDSAHSRVVQASASEPVNEATFEPYSVEPESASGDPGSGGRPVAISPGAPVAPVAPIEPGVFVVPPHVESNDGVQDDDLSVTYGTLLQRLERISSGQGLAPAMPSVVD